MEKRNNINKKNITIGVILVLLGMLMILKRSGIIYDNVYDFFVSWKMLLVVIGVFLISCGNKVGGVVVAIIGGFALIPEMLSEYREYFWPAAIILIGIAIISKPLNAKKTQVFFNAENSTNGDFDQKAGEHQNFQDNKGSKYNSPDYFEEVVIFGNREIDVCTKNLTGGETTAIFGSLEIDLRQSEFSSASPKVECNIIFGSCTLKVPNDWTVINRVTTIFGGFSDTRIKDPLYAPNPSKTIVITGDCLFGGIEIRNFNKVF